MRHILLTGAGGKIGAYFYAAYQDKYEFTLVDIRQPDITIKPGHRFIQADLSQPENIAPLLEGVTDVIHLAGNPSPDATFSELLPANILATTYLMAAAADAGVRRVVLASSAQTIEGYEADKQIHPAIPVNPANLYGVTKCYGEALGAYYANQGKLSVVALRIGAFEFAADNALHNARDLSAWDALHLLERAVETDGISFFIGYGISDNCYKRFDLSETKQVLQYQPADDAFRVYDLSLITGNTADRKTD